MNEDARLEVPVDMAMQEPRCKITTVLIENHPRLAGGSNSRPSLSVTKRMVTLSPALPTLTLRREPPSVEIMRNRDKDVHVAPRLTSE